MTSRFPCLLALACTLSAAPAAVPAQTAPGIDWTGPTPPAILFADPRFAPMLRWLEDAQRHGPGVVPMPYPLPYSDNSPVTPLPPIEGNPDVDLTQPVPPAAMPWLDFALRFAAPTPRAPVDTDQDGTVSDEEAAAHAEAIFVSLDADRDGALGPEEFLRMGAVLPFPGFTEMENTERQGRFDTMDGNGDGRVSKAEFMDVGRAHYEAARDTLTGDVTPWSYRRSDWY